MLVVTRTRGEAVHIGDDIVVVVAAVQGNRVRLAIAAPQETRILRRELCGSAVGRAHPAWSRDRRECA